FEKYPLLWALGLITAFLTAFYMFRMMFLTFYGNFRGKAQDLEHAHESPNVMTIPLVILAILSAIGGLINFPAIFGGNTWLAKWLTGAGVKEKVNALSHEAEYG